MLLTFAVVLLIIAIVAYCFGAPHVGEISVKIAIGCVVVALVLFLLSVLTPYGHWPY